MVYAAKSNAREQEFLDLLENSRKLLIKSLKSKSVSPPSFEDAVFAQMTTAAVGTLFEGTIRQTGTHAFPDIIASKYYGVEVKMTTSDHWISTGNSVLESSRVEDVDRIYILFGKFGGQFDIKYRLYQECLPEVSVTHSPRYRINMDLPIGKSIFDKIGVKYDDLRVKQNSIQIIKNYYRSKLRDGEELWWIDQDSEQTAVSPIIKPFRGLATKEKDRFMIETMILFPEIFSSKNTKFERPAAYLIAQYNAVSPNLRDMFTAGGKVEMNIKGKKRIISRLEYNLHLNAHFIRNSMKTIGTDRLKYYWRINRLKKNVVEQWKNLINKHAEMKKDQLKVSDIFEAGLK